MSIVDHRHTPCDRPINFDSNMPFARLKKLRMRQREYGANIVQRCTFEVIVKRLIHLAKKLKQPRQLRANNTVSISHHLNSRRRRHYLMRQVQATHHDLRARIKNCRRRLWVAPDIKFGHRRTIAKSATTHQRNTRNILDQIWRHSQRQRNVRQRPSRHQPHTRVRPHSFNNEMHRISTVSQSRRRRKIRTVHSAFTVNISGMNRLSHQRSTRTRVQLHFRRPTKIKDDSGIFSC